MSAAEDQPAPRFALVTTCKGRLAHVKQTLPRLCAQADAQVVLVDYDCPDQVGAWTRANHPDVVVVEVKDRPLFNLAEARNLGAAVSTAPWLVFLDADALADPGLTSNLATLLTPNAFLCVDAKPGALSGALVVGRADFDAVGGYDEVFEGWGSEDVDIAARLEIAGLSARTFPADWLASLPHDNAERTRFHAIADIWVNVEINSLYRMAKTDLIRLGAQLDLATRRSLYDQARTAVVAPDGPRTLRVSFRQSQHGRRTVQASLVYETRTPDRPTEPR